jgi:hypothetical protein
MVAGADTLVKEIHKLTDTGELNFLPAKSISTAKNASTPIGTGDITPQAVTDMSFTKSDDIIFSNDNENTWNTFASSVVDPAGENVGSVGVANVEKIGDGCTAQLRIFHIKDPDGVMWDNGSGPVSKLSEALSGVANDVPLPADHVNDILWVGSLEKFNAIIIHLTTTALGGSHALAALQYPTGPSTQIGYGIVKLEWNEADFAANTVFDELDGFRTTRLISAEPSAIPAYPAIVGTQQPLTWAQRSIGGSASMWWIGLKLVNATPTRAPLAQRIWVANLIDYSKEMGPWNGKTSFTIGGSRNESGIVTVEFQGYKKQTGGADWSAKHNIQKIDVGKR